MPIEINIELTASAKDGKASFHAELRSMKQSVTINRCSKELASANRALLAGAISALKAIKASDAVVTIHNNSKYLKGCVTQDIGGEANADLRQILNQQTARFSHIGFAV